MPNRRKRPNKLYIGLALVVIVVVASTALGYIAWTALSPPLHAGVKVGDTFTFALGGISELLAPDASTPVGFNQYNDTAFYQVTITGVNGTLVTMDTDWTFQNGTSIPDHQTIDLATGTQSNLANGFWAIYAANLGVGSRVHPSNGNDQVIVNGSDTQVFSSGARARNYWLITKQFADTTDPTGQTQRYDIVNVYFDKKTGMLTNLFWEQEYNNPQLNLYVTWRLMSTSAWQV